MTLLRFEPLFMERVWGGRRLAELYGKELPPDAPIGESWELVDRPLEQSLVRGGEHAGRTLGELWRGSRRLELFGSRAADWGERFPLLIKLLDAEDILSVQVHPPAAVAPALGGEPKTEAWFIADARPGAHLLAGMRRGASRTELEQALRVGGDAAALLHQIEVAAGDAIFIPSGRVHAIGAGNVIFEVQQNSDTTYRVYDFGRMGLDGVPRELHVEQSLQSIDFDDVEPSLADRANEPLVSCAFFELEHLHLGGARRGAAPPGEMAILAALSGGLQCAGEPLEPGELVLACADDEAQLDGSGELLRVTLPR